MSEEQYLAITDWQNKTFGADMKANVKLCHLSVEVDEVLLELHEGTEESIRLEFADCFILLFGAARSVGMSYADIQSCIDEKMVINRKRVWGKPNADGVVSHIKTEDFGSN